SVGGKTGINTRHGKNLVGTFYQPRLVLADTGVLDTLPDRHLRAGYAEVVKYGVIADREFFAWLERNGETLIAGDHQARTRAIERSCRMKAEIVGEDERESGRRAILNLGHTFGHALEVETGYGESLLHGEAVAAGMCFAMELSVRLGMCANEELSRLRRHLTAVGLPAGLPRRPEGRWNAERLLDLMTSDKKVRGGQPTFILVRGIGRAFVARDVPLDVVRGVLTDAAAAA
ncbi:MAG: 3-dehydroquinate synthase family protein, partial [Alphaproteobacteria bacterium]